MTKDNEKYQAYVQILNEELIPAMGCTEPIALAYAAAKAREVLGCLPDRVCIGASGSIIKNVKSVIVPNTNHLKGIPAAAAAGIVAGNAEKELEVISEVTEEETKEIAGFLEHTEITVEHINVNYMLNKDIINRRLETGITYAEFSYMLIQGYDFLNMYRKMNCVMQVEGSDQWGNITTGIDLIRKIDGKEAYAFTMPLILDSNGKKFGKSEGNALWLDKDKTSSYALYQYLINTDDAKVLEYLKVFTFLTPEEILDVMDRHNKEPHLRIAQETLAKCIITDLRGEEEYTKARDISKALFSEDIKNLSSEDIVNSLSGVKNVLVYEGNIVDVLVDSKVFSSKREARELITGNALSINNKKVNDVNYIISKNDLIDNKIVVIKKGKKNYFIGKFN